MENATHRHLMNPALAPARGYVSLPVLGSLSMATESNMLYTNFFYPSETGSELVTFLHPDIDATEFLSKLDPVNYMRMDMRTSILSIGFYKDKGFWTFDMASRVNMSTNMPYEFFSFLKEGMSSSTGNLYQIKDLSLGANMFFETSLGYSRDIMGNLRVGGKIKLLSGIANVSAKINQMDINMTPDVWTVTSDGQIDAYGKGLSFKLDEEQKISGVEMGSAGLGGSGLAVDLGASYFPIENLNVSLGIVDLGAIKWKKENIKKATASGTASFSGIDGINADDNTSAEDQLEEVKDDFMELVSFKEQTVTSGQSQGLFPTLNLGAEYSLLNNLLGVGMLFSSRFMENDEYSELTGSLNYRPNEWFNLAGSCSFLQGNKRTLGFAIGLSPKFVNLFLACDYTLLKVSPQFIPINSSTTNFQLGLSIPLRKEK